VQNRWPACLVGHPVVDSVRELHHRNNSLHRPGKKFWERSGVWDWFDSAGNHFLPDSRLRQRAISRTLCWKFDAESGAAGCVTDFREQRSTAILAGGPPGVSPAEWQHIKRPGSPRDESVQLADKMPGRRTGWSLCYDLTQPGLRFSLKAAIPSRASSDSRACM
jgi:hypothetical protein